MNEKKSAEQPEFTFQWNDACEGSFTTVCWETSKEEEEEEEEEGKAFSLPSTSFVGRQSADRTPNKHLLLEKDDEVAVKDLVEALEELGLKPNASKLRTLRQNLEGDDEGEKSTAVTFGRFVDEVRRVFRDELRTHSWQQETRCHCCKQLQDLVAQNQALMEENNRLKKELQCMESVCSRTEDQLIVARKKLQMAIQEMRKNKTMINDVESKGTTKKSESVKQTNRKRTDEEENAKVQSKSGEFYEEKRRQTNSNWSVKQSYRLPSSVAVTIMTRV